MKGAAAMDTVPWYLNETLLLTTLMDNIADSIYFKDRYCRLVRVSRKMASDLGYKDQDELTGKTDVELFGEEFGRKTLVDDLHIMETGQSIIGLVESRTLPDGDTNWTSTTKLPIRDQNGDVVGVLGITREINELKRVELDLQYLATHDILTSLPNRYLLLDRIEQTILRARRNHTLIAVLYIDLDGFKGINDRYGHDTGDQVLKQIALRLTKNVRDSDTVARMGGDEFVIVLDAIKEDEDSMLVAQKLRERIEAELITPKSRVEVTASIGISIYPKHGVDAASLLKAADHAMYEAKQSTNTCMIFMPPKIPS
jgi:diguanylate cyclase (GGDEF)-like protein/PAS domain S-box-containing protein